LPDRRFSRANPFFTTTKRAPTISRRLEIHAAESAAEIVMRVVRETVLTRCAEDMVLHVTVLIDAIRHVLSRQVRKRGELRIQILVGDFRGGVELRQRGLELGDFSHQLGRARLVLRLLGFADLLGRRIAPCLRCSDARIAARRLSSIASSDLLGRIGRVG
jgi:hypothetical protein